jgi:quaternary ammonium compound-resistance protein SugE
VAWIVLAVAGVLEIGWAIGLKYTEGFTRPWPTLATVASMVASMGMLGIAVNSLPVGTAYAVWTGIGTIGTALLGLVLFGEPASAARLACIAMIAAGILGLKIVTPD